MGDAGFTCELTACWNDGVEALVRNATPETPFQHHRWLSTWYRTLGSRGDVTPLIVTIRRRGDGALAAVLPLISRAAGRTRAIEFADLDITDYNAPIPGPASPQIPEDATAFVAALLEALASHGDVLNLTKMLDRTGGVPNPLTLAGRCTPSMVNGNVLHIQGTWEQHQRGLERRFRKELERSSRVFERDGDNARFVAATSLDEAMLILTAIEQQQRTRITERGLPYRLDGPLYHNFYETLVAEGLADGYTVVTALMTGEADVVGALLGICDGRSYAMIRLSHASRSWAHCSPGRLVIDRTMHHLHNEGLRRFDFTTGDYDYKTRFAVERVGLHDLREPLSLLGHLIVGRQRAAEGIMQKVRQLPILQRGLLAVKQRIARLNTRV